MTKIIINADDCGQNSIVNQSIEHFIEINKLSSTTIIANMDDFYGALRLYEKYHERVSFGIHLNMTQGKPLLYSQLLLDKQIIIENNGNYYFSGNFPYYLMDGDLKQEVKRELNAQISKVMDSGVKPTHLDGHHHIHTYPSMLTLTPQLLRDFKIGKVRRMRNYFLPSMQLFLRSSWLKCVQLQNPGVRSTDYFAGIKEFFSNPIRRDGLFELMCHPGGFDNTEFEFMENLQISPKIELISYHQL